MARLKRKKYDPIKIHLKHPSIVMAGKGPHRAQLFCTKCKKHIKWLTSAEIAVADNLKY